MVPPILIVAAIISALALLWYHLRMIRKAASIPGPPIWPLLGNAILFITRPGDQISLIANVMKNYGQYVRLWLGPELNVVVGDPADVRRLLMGNKVNKKGPAYEYMKKFIGPGVLSGGPTWRLHRKIANSSYNKKAVQQLAMTSNKYAKRLGQELRCKQPGVMFNVYHDVVKCTTLSVCESIMGLSEEEINTVRSLDAVVANTHDLYEFAFTNMTYWWFRILPIYYLCGRKSKERFFQRHIDAMTSDIVALRREHLKNEVVGEPLGVVDRYILSEQLTDEELKWETMTFFTASQEATAKIASMVLLIFAHHQDWQEKVYNEIIQTFGSNEDTISEEELKQLTSLDMVYKEAVRYMPIGAVIQRTAEEDVTVNDGKYTIPAGASILFPIHLIHRDSQQWDEPDKIKPERFSAENSRCRDPNYYLPFSLGAMDCIGRIYAEPLVKLIAVQTLRQVHLEADGNIEDLEISAAISVKFVKGYNLRVSPRKP